MCVCVFVWHQWLHKSGKTTPRVKPKPFGFEPYPKSASKLENVGSSSEILYEMNTTREEKQINSNSNNIEVSVNEETSNTTTTINTSTTKTVTAASTKTLTTTTTPGWIYFLLKNI